MQIKAIILKKQNTGEYDQWVTCYTEEFGKLTAIAKSILKPSSIQALHLDTFNLAEFDLISGRGMPIIAGAQVIDSFMGVKSSLVKTAVAYFFAEAVDKMVFENDKDDELWFFLVSFLEELDKFDHNPNIQMISECSEYKKSDFGLISLFRQSQTKLLDILGYFPEIDICKSCEDKLGENNFGAFNHVWGGVVCKKCFLSGQGGILISGEDFNLLKGVSTGQAYLDQRSGNTAKRLYWSDQYSTGLTSKAITLAVGRSVLDGMFEYISGSKFYSLDLLSVLRY